MQLRFVAKKVSINGTKKPQWRVYDKFRGSFPYTVPDLGEVAQDHDTELLAQTEADRLTAAFGYLPEGKPARKKAPVQDGDDDEHDD